MLDQHCRLAPAVLLSALFSCSPASTPHSQDWAVAARVALPTGAALQPDDPSRPGEAGPQAVAYADGQIFVAYTNLFEESQPAGPSWVSVHDPSTLALIAKIELVDGATRCTDAGSMLVVGDTLLVSCSGVLSADPSMPGQGALAEVSVSQHSVIRVVPIAGTPGAILQSGSSIWLADLGSSNLLRVDADSGMVLNEHGGTAPSPQVCAPQAAVNYASDLILASGRAFAACIKDNTIQEFAPSNGAPIGSAVSLGPSADSPVRFAFINGQLVVVCSISGTLAVVSLTSPTVTVSSGVINVGGSDLEGIDGDSSFAAVANSAYGTLDIFDVTQGFKIVASVDTKDTPMSSANDPYGVVDANGSFYVAAAGWGATPELIRVTKTH